MQLVEAKHLGCYNLSRRHRSGQLLHHLSPRLHVLATLRLLSRSSSPTALPEPDEVAASQSVAMLFCHLRHGGLKRYDSLWLVGVSRTPTCWDVGSTHL